MTSARQHLRKQMDRAIAVRKEREVVFTPEPVEPAKKSDVAPAFVEGVRSQIGRLGVGGLGNHKPIGSPGDGSTQVEASAEDEKPKPKEKPKDDPEDILATLTAFSRRAKRILAQHEAST